MVIGNKEAFCSPFVLKRADGDAPARRAIPPRELPGVTAGSTATKPSMRPPPPPRRWIASAAARARGSPRDDGRGAALASRCDHVNSPPGRPECAKSGHPPTAAGGSELPKVSFTPGIGESCHAKVPSTRHNYELDVTLGGLAPWLRRRSKIARDRSPMENGLLTTG